MMALFGHDDVPDAAFRAVSAGLTMLEEVEKRSRHFEELYGVNASRIESQSPGGYNTWLSKARPDNMCYTR